jgi:hypothetical protein
LLIKSSKLGGSLLEPEPVPEPFLPPEGLDPQGDCFFKIFSLIPLTLYIVTFCSKTS